MSSKYFQWQYAIHILETYLPLGLAIASQVELSHTLKLLTKTLESLIKAHPTINYLPQNQNVIGDINITENATSAQSSRGPPPPPPPPPPPNNRQPQPPQNNKIPPPPPPPPQSHIPKSTTDLPKTLYDKSITEKDIIFINSYNADLIEGDDPEFIDAMKMKEVERLKNTGLLSIETVVAIVNGQKDEAYELEIASQIIQDRQKKAKEELQKALKGNQDQALFEQIRARGQKIKESYILQILKMFEAQNDSEQLKTIRETTDNTNKYKRFVRFYKELTNSPSFAKFEERLDNETIKDVYHRLEAAGYFQNK